MSAACNPNMSTFSQSSPDVPRLTIAGHDHFDRSATSRTCIVPLKNSGDSVFPSDQGIWVSESGRRRRALGECVRCRSPDAQRSPPDSDSSVRNVDLHTGSRVPRAIASSTSIAVGRVMVGSVSMVVPRVLQRVRVCPDDSSRPRWISVILGMSGTVRCRKCRGGSGDETQQGRGDE